MVEKRDKEDYGAIYYVMNCLIEKGGSNYGRDVFYNNRMQLPKMKN